ncbi:hypothetical protein ECE50_018305 [Chitinophaga sp. Mgbs1]|uniref:Uncharacterized protein n=1 Tax=Chitinophaga solisilvae TaxID=1233460 RepID=A0A433WAE3_9BACT|nr:hypothetical protein [Chitinophaga solisilvae]
MKIFMTLAILLLILLSGVTRAQTTTTGVHTDTVSIYGFLRPKPQYADRMEAELLQLAARKYFLFEIWLFEICLQSVFSSELIGTEENTDWRQISNNQISNKKIVTRILP